MNLELKQRSLSIKDFISSNESMINKNHKLRIFVKIIKEHYIKYLAFLYELINKY